MYGTKHTDMSGIADALSEALAISFQLRDSSYWGGDYYLAKDAKPVAKSIKLHPNLDIIDKTPIYPSEHGYHLILHADGIMDQRALEAALEGYGFERMEP